MGEIRRSQFQEQRFRERRRKPSRDLVGNIVQGKGGDFRGQAEVGGEKAAEDEE